MQPVSSAALSGIQAAAIRHDIGAHDVANVNTQGFEERRPHQVEASPAGTRISHVSRRPAAATGYSNTSLVEEMTEMTTNRNSLAANANVLRKQNEMLGEAIDLLA
ncbi:MAG: hypothetical protein GF398_05330 [Chitinivibrionales bacterium]|nr:hypothetical protein [Chitinivibrionales bacterium]